MKYKIDNVEFEVNLENIIKHEIHGIDPEFHDVKYASIEHFLQSDSIAGYIVFIDFHHKYPYDKEIIYYNFSEKKYAINLVWNNWMIRQVLVASIYDKSKHSTFQLICPKGQTENYDLYNPHTNYYNDLAKLGSNEKYRPLIFLQIASHFPNRA